MRLALAGWKACEKICQLELSSDAIDDLVSKKLAENETTLKKQFKDFDQWPADAQLAILSLGWARGAAGFETAMPKFSRFLSQPGGPDFAGAATECRLTKDEKTDYSHFMRNNANQQLFRNAAAVVAGEPDGFYRRELLYYPMVVMPPMIIEGKAGEQIDD
jgi:hypothetical protein